MRSHSPFAMAAAVFVVAVAVSAGAPRAQQHSYTPQEIEEGRRLYDANCGRCHNTDGAGVPGVELFRQIRRANSDEDIAKLIQAGIPATSMPPHSFTNPQALAVVAFLRAMVGVKSGAVPVASGTRSTATSGDAARGRQIFTGKGGCADCHRAEGAGSRSGPDLSGIGAVVAGPIPIAPAAALLERSILEPNADITPAFRVFQVTPKTGAQVRGTLLNQDTFSVQMLDEDKNLRSFLKADLKDYGFFPSPMPSYQGRLTPQEISDVVSYLLSLKG